MVKGETGLTAWLHLVRETRLVLGGLVETTIKTPDYLF